jgi:hypothetical protein
MTAEPTTVYPECTALCSDVEQDRDAMHPIVEAAFGLVHSWRIMGSVIAPDTTPATLLAAVEAYERAADRHGSSRGAPTTPTVGEETSATDPEPQIPAEEFAEAIADMTARAAAVGVRLSPLMPEPQFDRMMRALDHEPPQLEDPFVAVTRNEYASLRRGAGALVAELLDLSANLEEHIQTRAHEIAKPQVDAAVIEANKAMRLLSERAAFDKQRSDNVIAGLHAEVEDLNRSREALIAEVAAAMADDRGDTNPEVATDRG